MSNSVTIRPDCAYELRSGSPELTITNKGYGEAVYYVSQGGKKPKREVLSGTGSMQNYENVQYPFIVDNQGPDAIILT